MRVSLSPDAMIGHWSCGEVSVCEFQVGEMLIFVEHPKPESNESYLAAARDQIQQVLSEKGVALEAAKLVSAKRHPVFWAEIESLSLQQDVLTPFSIRFGADKCRIAYEISWNPCFSQKLAYEKRDTKGREAISVPAFPDDEEFIIVQRVGKGCYQNVAQQVAPAGRPAASRPAGG